MWGRESPLLEKAHQFEAVLFDLVDRVVFGPSISSKAALGR
jgi:hypothetical protein